MTTWHLSDGLSYLSPKLRLLDWPGFPMTCLPSNVTLEFLVELNMPYIKLEKLWDGIQLLRNLKWMDLNSSKNLKELPNLSTATILQKLNLIGCSSLVELPYFIGNATNLQILDLSYCSSLVELFSSIGNIIVNYGNLHKLRHLGLIRYSKLQVLPINDNWKSLDRLDLSGCPSLKSFPEISTNVSYLNLSGTAIEEVPPLVKGFSRLRTLKLRGCKEILSLPQLPDSLSELDAKNCESLERLDCSFPNPRINLKFGNCFKLNKEARDLLIQRSTLVDTLLPGKEIPTYFTHRANGGSLIVEFNERFFPSSLICKVCILLVKNDVEDSDEENDVEDSDEKTVLLYDIKSDEEPVLREPLQWSFSTTLTEHLYIFEYEEEDVTSDIFEYEEVTSNKLFFEFWIDDEWVIKECGVHIIAKNKKNEGDSVGEEGENEGESVAEEEENEGGRVVSVVFD